MVNEKLSNAHQSSHYSPLTSLSAICQTCRPSVSVWEAAVHSFPTFCNLAVKDNVSLCILWSLMGLELYPVICLHSTIWFCLLVGFLATVCFTSPECVLAFVLSLESFLSNYSCCSSLILCDWNNESELVKH